MTSECPFCEKVADLATDETVILDSEIAFLCFSQFAVSKWHLLIIPHRHVTKFNDLTLEERAVIMDLMKRGINIINQNINPDGYNVGFNEGAAGGQTVEHFHVHIIPRFNGDVEDPRGGIRNVIPGKGPY